MGRALKFPRTQLAQKSTLCSQKPASERFLEERSYFPPGGLRAMQRIPSFPRSKFQDYPVKHSRDADACRGFSDGGGEREREIRGEPHQYPYGLSVARSGKGEKEKTRTRPRKHPTSDRQAPMVSKHRASVCTGRYTRCLRSNPLRDYDQSGTVVSCDSFSFG